MAIACAYCNGEHDSPAQIRQCWHDNGQLEVPLDDGGLPDDASAEATAATESDAQHRSTHSPDSQGAAPARSMQRAGIEPQRFPRGVAPAEPGPDALARNGLVSTGDQIVAPWADAERVVISADTLTDPGSALAVLRSAHHDRRRLVIELATDFDRQPKLKTEAQPYEVGADFTFELEELHHLVWANAVDLRGDTPTWIALDQAIALGATTVPATGLGDIRTPSGDVVWLDAGPVRHTDPVDGVAVLHAVAIEHRSFVAPAANVSDADLAPDQLEAVTHPGGAARIIAPAGSGKTRVLTERARHLLRVWNLPASAVSLVAFNKRAQEEMLERTPDLPGLQVRTLNALALAIVNGAAPFAAQPMRWNTINEVDVRRIIGDLVSFPRRRNSDPVAPWIEALSLIRLGLVDPSDAEARYDGDVEGLAAAWPAYRAALERKRAVDFDDQIHRALLVLLSQPDARRAAQRACRLMLVDEFQDLTPAHLLLIRLLASPGGAVFGVGDDDQTIYGYNGADPSWLIDFADLFPGAGTHPLEVNYRCPAGVVQIVDRLLRHNGRRVAKTIRANSTDTGGWNVDTAVDPISATQRAVEDALRSGAPADHIAVLTRVNALLAPVQVALAVNGIPISGGVGLEFADRTAVRSVLAWLRLATRDTLGPDDIREALRRPSRSFHPRINDWVCEQRSIVDLHRLAGRLNTERDQERVTDFAADIQTLQQMVKDRAPTSDLVLTLIDRIGLAGAVGTLDAHRRGMNRAAQGDDLTAIQHLAALHDDVATFEPWLREHLAVRRQPGGVTLSTVHRVKGQEWPHVVVHLADAEQYPHRLAEDVEEERRLFHVAITRASKHATIVTGPSPSPFVAELTTEPSAEPAERAVVSSHRPESAKRSTSPSKTDPTADLDEAAERRFAALKELRNQLRDGKPAYVVFDNKTLVSIARMAPTSKSELAKISGVGPAKLDKYGDAVTELMTGLAG
ncbi:ATP-dependent helicase [Ilumatobacter sp.]|uniref:ATP-dependent helicase n=1 Tax=Ilumatobacter sp. TaxID=1967498 RepID=UPI003F6AB754